MPIFKSTMFFEGRAHGWSETWWQNETETDYNRPMDNLKALAKKRAKLMGDECIITGLRVSREDELGESFLEYVTYKGVLQQPTAAHDLAVLLSVRDGTNKRKKHTFLRGFWDAVEVKNGRYLKNFPDWKDAMADFRNELTGEGKGGIWGWWGVNVKHKRFLATFTVDADDRITFGYDANYFAPALIGKFLELSVKGINGKSSMNRKYIVQVLGETAAITKDAYATVSRRFGGESTYVTKDYVQIKGASDQKITRRAVGSPLLESRGRARAKPHG